jgi:hypothetical protein
MPDSTEQINTIRHINAIDQAIQRNIDLIQLYNATCDEMAGDVNVASTIRLYRRLSDELVVANQRIQTLRQSLLARIDGQSSSVADLLTTFSGINLQSAARSQDNTTPPTHSSPSHSRPAL